MTPPDFQPSVSLAEVFLFAALNPATVIISIWMGRNADQRAKILLAAFAGAVAAALLLNAAAFLRLSDAPNLARASAGVFAAALLFGLVYAGIGFATRKPKP